jgi:hypothetical protein
MLRHVALVIIDVSKEHIASIIRVTRIGEQDLGISSQRASLASYCSVVPSSPILVTLMMEAIRSSETSVLKWATLRIIPEHGILHGHRREDLKCYKALTGWLDSVAET